VEITMRAAVLHEFGPAENLRYESVEDPKPGPGQVRIAVHAAGVHFIDTGIRSGRPGGPAPTPVLPMIGGREVAGVVDEVGPDVDASWQGRRVVAHLGLRGAGYAELAVADAVSLHVLPEQLDAAAAVAMIGTGRTAFAILERAQLSAEDVVLVTSAAGGLGVLLVQAALDVGAIVVAAAGGPEKVERVRQLGATVAVDYDREGWAGTVRDALDGRAVSIVLDGVGGLRGRAGLELLGLDGRFLVYGFSSGEPTPLSVMDLIGRGITASAAIGSRLLRRPGGFRDLEDAALAALTTGRMVPLVTRFPLAEAAAAHAALENRETVGKVVLIP
jgi:NADPH2:quinone reductase